MDSCCIGDGGFMSPLPVDEVTPMLVPCRATRCIMLPPSPTSPLLHDTTHIVACCCCPVEHIEQRRAAASTSTRRSLGQIGHCVGTIVLS